MATQPAYEAPPIELPVQVNGSRRLFCSTQTQQRAAFPVIGDDGQPYLGKAINLPIGTKEIYFQSRMCGDFYCFIEGSRMVSATADTLEAAFSAALKKAAA